MIHKKEGRLIKNDEIFLESAAYSFATFTFMSYIKADPITNLLSYFAMGLANAAVRKITNHKYGLFDGAYAAAKNMSDYLDERTDTEFLKKMADLDLKL